MRHLATGVAIAALLSTSASLASAQPPGGGVSAAALAAAIDRLGSLDDAARIDAARTVRRADAPQAVMALTRAVAEEADGFVRFRALVLLTGFNDPRTRDVMLGLLHDPNDRLRGAAYGFFEYHPDNDALAELVASAATEHAEFVRPALLRALAARASDPRVRTILLEEVARGGDVARSVAIEALGRARASYAVVPLAALAQKPGPLQGDAALALGRAGDKSALPVLASLQRTAPPDMQPTVAAAICLLGVSCANHLPYLEKTVRFAEDNTGFQPLVRNAARGLGALAEAGNRDAMNLLFDLGVPASEPVRAPLALAAGAAALRDPAALLEVLEARPDRSGPLALLRDAFDMLEEDLAKEQFYATVRRAYWQAPDDSAAKNVTGELISRLEF
jgi:HEAT repeat protein